MSQVPEQKPTEQAVDEWKKEGYSHFKHKIDNVEMVFYLKHTPGVSWVHAFEGAFDFADYFKRMLYQSRQQAAKKKEEEISSTDVEKEKKAE